MAEIRNVTLYSYTNPVQLGGFCQLTVRFEYISPGEQIETWGSVGNGYIGGLFDAILTGSNTRDLPAASTWTPFFASVLLLVPSSPSEPMYLDPADAPYDVQMKVRTPGGSWVESPNYLDIIYFEGSGAIVVDPPTATPASSPPTTVSIEIPISSSFDTSVTALVTTEITQGANIGTGTLLDTIPVTAVINPGQNFITITHESEDIGGDDERDLRIKVNVGGEELFNDQFFAVFIVQPVSGNVAVGTPTASPQIADPGNTVTIKVPIITDMAGMSATVRCEIHQGANIGTGKLLYPIPAPQSRVLALGINNFTFTHVATDEGGDTERDVWIHVEVEDQVIYDEFHYGLFSVVKSSEIDIYGEVITNVTTPVYDGQICNVTMGFYYTALSTVYLNTWAAVGSIQKDGPVKTLPAGTNQWATVTVPVPITEALTPGVYKAQVNIWTSGGSISSAELDPAVTIIEAPVEPPPDDDEDEEGSNTGLIVAGIGGAVLLLALMMPKKQS